MITVDSRYNVSPVEKLDTTRGTVLTIVGTTQEELTISFTSHMWSASDRPDTVSAEFYGDDSKWWLIADANPEILDWSDVSPGTVVRIPNG